MRYALGASLAVHMYPRHLRHTYAHVHAVLVRTHNTHIYTYTYRRKKQRGRKVDREGVKSKNWVQAKKDRARKQGQDVRHDSKFTARKRKPKF